jgi:cytoskeletal protein RodZ
VVLVSLLVAGVVISMQDPSEIEPEIAPRVDTPVDPVRPALVESSDLTGEPEIDQGTEVQLSDAARAADDEALADESDIEATDPDMSDESVEAVAEAPIAEDSPAPPVEVTETSPDATDEQQAAEVADRVDNTEPEVAEVEESPAPSDRSVEESTAAVTQPEPAETPAQTAPVADVAPTASESENASAVSAQVPDEPPARAPVSQGRVIAEAANLEAPSIDPVSPAMEGSPADDGLRVLSETVTGPNADDQAMGARGLLEMRFTGESWVEVRDARGRLVVADLMEAGRFVSLQTFGPVEVLVGAVNDSTVIFNGETLDLSGRSYQNVARVTLGAETN